MNSDNLPLELKQELSKIIKIIEHHEINPENVYTYFDLKKILRTIDINEVEEKDIKTLMENIDALNESVKTRNPELINKLYETLGKEKYHNIIKKIITQIPCNQEYKIML